jgi:uncharacterized protein YtpQ (UPF0354 family)
MGLLKKLFGPPSKDRFAKLVLAGIRRAGERREIVYDQGEFRLHTTERKGMILNLDNAYPEYCDAPKSARPEVLRKWVRLWFSERHEIPDEFEHVRMDLRPVVNSRSHYELFNLQFQLEGREVAPRPHFVLGEHFAVGLVYDLPETMQHVTQDNLDGWGVTYYEGLEAARENLAQLDFACIGPGEGEGLWLSMAKDSYDAARILLVDILRNFRVRGDVVAMIPNRETLLVAGTEDADALKAMLTLAEEGIRQPRRISAIALRLEGDDWTPWLPPAEHPLHLGFRNLRTQTLGQDYAEQKQLLDKLHEKTGEDIFVASYSGIERKETGEVTTYCVWTEDVLTLLPPADLVAFVRRDQSSFMVPWDRAVEVVGDLLEPLDMYPERYRVDGFPTEEQLKAMGGDALSLDSGE